MKDNILTLTLILNVLYGVFGAFSVGFYLTQGIYSGLASIPLLVCLILNIIVIVAEKKRRRLVNGR